VNKLSDFLNENQINNIFNSFSNIFVIRYDKDAKIENNYAGELLLKVKIKKDKKYIKVNDFVTFRIDKIKWTNNKNICIVDPYWIKPYINNEKLSIKVKVLRSRLVEDNREYYFDYDYINMTYKQFMSRRIIEKFGSIKHSMIEAYSNFQKRRPIVGYYKALNETSKHYFIKHDTLKNEIIPTINNSLKEFKKEWNDLYIQELKNNKARKTINDLIQTNKSSKAKIIEFESLKVY